ncbi:MAG: hypothetical protein ABR985_15535 [Methanotrichaceae archaeon]
MNDTTPPTILGITVIPSSLKVGDPRAEIQANVYDQNCIKVVYAEVGTRMNLMLDLRRTNQYTGFCGSNLPPGTYRVSIVAVDKVGNAAQAEATTNLTILDPSDLNDDHIEDSLEKKMDKDLRVIVLHDDNLSVHGADRFKILPASSMIVPGSKLDELAHLKGVKGIYEDQKLKVQVFRGNSPVEMKG